VLVAGAGGFLGRHLVRRLIQEGAEVLAVTRTSQGEAGDRVRWWRADMKDSTAVRAAVEAIKPDVVYQLCGHPDANRDLRLVLPTLESDILTTVNLLSIVTEQPVSRFITTASLEQPAPGEPATSPYAVAKMSSVAYARMFHLLYKVPVVILRPFMTYGPEQPETKVISYTIKRLLEHRPPKLSSGQRMVDWIYVDDVIDGFLAAAQTVGIEGETFDLGTGRLASIREVAIKLAKLSKSDVEPIFGALPDRPFEQVRAADTRTAKLKLGWEARVSLEDGLRLTVEWWKKRIATLPM